MKHMPAGTRTEFSEGDSGGYVLFLFACSIHVLVCGCAPMRGCGFAVRSQRSAWLFLRNHPLYFEAGYLTGTWLCCRLDYWPASPGVLLPILVALGL